MSCKSKEQKEWEDASRRTSRAVGETMGGLLGNETLMALWGSFGILIRAAKTEAGEYIKVPPKNTLQTAAAGILCVAGLLKQSDIDACAYTATEVGRSTAERIFHLK